MAAAPGSAEIARRLDDAITELRGLRAEIASTYVRQDVYAADQRLTTNAHVEFVNDISDLKKINERRDENETTTRRLVYLAILTAVLTPLIAILLSHALRAS